MNLFDNVGGINKTNTNYGINKIEKAPEANKIGVISFKFENAPAQVERAIELFGEDAAYALEFNNFAANFDPEANLL